MDTATILMSLRNQRDRVDAAISALEGSGVRGGRAANIGGNGVGRGGRRGRMSAAARKRMSQAQKKRRAAEKKKG
jgi:hypothetical protein